MRIRKRWIEDRNIRREVLPNGLRVITEEMQHIRSVSIGIWVKTGSRDEDKQRNGISHFVEHMVFKGTEHRSAEDIAKQVDSIGGNLDAFTAKECIELQHQGSRRAPADCPGCAQRPGSESRFSIEHDISRERGVILEEIKMDEDNPDYLVHEIFTQNFWKDHPLGPAYPRDPRHRTPLRTATGTGFLQPAIFAGQCDHQRRQDI